jgi:hypothetical protein
VRLRRFWFTFDPDNTPPGMAAGCGVTALDRDDALALVGSWLGTAAPSLGSVIDDVDVSTLDAKHVLPNMLPPNERGVWYPMSSYH